MTAPTPHQQSQAQPDASTAAMMAAYLGASAALRSRLLAMVAAVYVSQGNYRDAAADAFVAAMVPAVQAAQQTMGALTSAYLAHLVAGTAGGTAAPIGVPADVLSNLRGVDPTEVYRRPYVQVWTDLSQGKSFDDAVAAGGRRAASLAATDLQLAKTKAAEWVMRDDRRVVGYRRVLVGAHSCGMCIVASSVRYHKSDLMPIHPGCVVEGTRVSISGIKAITRRRYSGKLTIITTTSGNQLTVTSEHPILTDQGWIPAHLISEDHSVIRSLGAERVQLGRPNESHRPALIEDVWRAHSVSPIVRVPMTSQDFHGDGSNGEVDIIYVDRSLDTVSNSKLLEKMRKRKFMSRDGIRGDFSASGCLASFFPSGHASSGSDVGCFSLSSSLFAGHLCGAHEAGVRASARRDVRLFERRPDGSALHPVSLSERQLGGAPSVLSGNDIVRQVVPSSSPRRFDPARAQFSGQGLGVYGRLGRSLSDRLTGLVEHDRVVFVRHVDTTPCHVYNLHTDEGWYTADGLIVSNCDCAVAPIMGHNDPGRTIDSAILTEGAQEQAAGSQGMKFFDHNDVLEVGDLLEQAHQAVADAFGQRATDAHAIDYRKVIMVREHGELGPVLTVADHNFTKQQLDSGNLRAKAGTYHTVKGREVTNIGE